MTQLDYDLDRYYESLDKAYECTECGKPIEHEGVCSGVCHESSMR